MDIEKQTATEGETSAPETAPAVKEVAGAA